MTNRSLSAHFQPGDLVPHLGAGINEGAKTGWRWGREGGSLSLPGLRCAILKAILSADVLSELAQKNLEMT